MGEQSSIGANWTDMSPSDPPARAERRAQAAARAKGLPKVRHKIHMRYERLFDVWRVTFTCDGELLRECRFERDETLEETVRKGRGFTCLADRQALELGMRQGLGMVTLHLDSEQYASLNQPR